MTWDCIRSRCPSGGCARHVVRRSSVKRVPTRERGWWRQDNRLIDIENLIHHELKPSTSASLAWSPRASHRSTRPDSYASYYFVLSSTIGGGMIVSLPKGGSRTIENGP